MKDVIVSIIIPMYNEERYISRCLESLQHQTYKDFEVILIDDGSKDNTIQKTQGYKKHFNLTILKQYHSWPGNARNRWAKEAKGNILVFVDADMFFDKDYLKYLIQPILVGKEIGTAHGQELVGNSKNKLAIAWCINRIPHPEKRSWVYRAIRKEIFLDSGWFDPKKWYFDDDLSKINNGEWALTVMDAICYHNNPERIEEIFNHSQRVWKSLMQSWEMKNYIKKYSIWLSILVLVLILWIIFFKQEFWIIVGTFILVILFLIFKKASIRAVKEKQLSHIIYIPLVIIIRGVGYIVWILRYLFIKFK